MGLRPQMSLRPQRGASHRPEGWPVLARVRPTLQCHVSEDGLLERVRLRGRLTEEVRRKMRLVGAEVLKGGLSKHGFTNKGF